MTPSVSERWYLRERRSWLGVGVSVDGLVLADRISPGRVERPCDACIAILAAETAIGWAEPADLLAEWLP